MSGIPLSFDRIEQGQGTMAKLEVSPRRITFQRLPSFFILHVTNESSISTYSLGKTMEYKKLTAYCLAALCYGSLSLAAEGPIRFRLLYTIDGVKNDDKMGCYVSKIGDWDGDGYDDFVVGAPGIDIPPVGDDVGHIFVYSGAAISGGGGSTVLDGTHGPDVDGALGDGVGYMNDIDGDQQVEVIASAPHADNDRGKVWVYRGGGGMGPLYRKVIPANPSDVMAGSKIGEDNALDGIGPIEVNSKTYDAVIIGAEATQRAYVFGIERQSPTPTWGNLGEFEKLVELTPNGGGSTTAYGRAVAGVGLVVGNSGQNDTFEDFVVGAPDAVVNGQKVGKVTLYSGKAVNGAFPEIWSRSGEYWEEKSNGSTPASSTAHASFGYAVASAGDWDNNGTPDVLVGAYHTFDNFGFNNCCHGRVYVYQGDTGDLLYDWQPRHHGSHVGLNYYYTGYSVGGGVDFDGDNYSDIIVGCPGVIDFTTLTEPGRTFVIRGNTPNIFDRGSNPPTDTVFAANGLLFDATNDEVHNGTIAGDGMGYHVEAIGDVNNDGLQDFATSSPFIDKDLGNGVFGNDRGQVKIYAAYRLGDVNGSGVVDVSDYAYLYSHIEGTGPCPVPIESGDVNRDGALTPADHECLAGYLFYGTESSLPCNCSDDNEFDLGCTNPVPATCAGN